jgi:UDP-galactopyranose mutase
VAQRDATEHACGTSLVEAATADDPSVPQLSAEGVAVHRPSLIVYSHLRWDSVFQRPHHLMTRLASHFDVWFVEEPQRTDTAPRIAARAVAPGLTVCHPQTAIDVPGFSAAQIAAATPLLETFFAARAAPRRINWLYTPMALPLATAIPSDLTVYDCMDELAAFRFAPPEILERERELLARADLVFTGGPSLYRAKRDRHPNVRCFPSSVDVAHFAAAIAGPEAADQRPLARPRCGFFGVIDERLDTALIDALAAARPSWQIVLIGPVVKIDPADLPRRPNIHYLGARPYAELPSYLAGWDLCLLPFARNDATRFISPTKTLEYMAAEKAIVSTSIRDVAEPYGTVVEIADAADAFVAACERLLTEPAPARRRRRAAMQAIVARTSWDRTAAAMRALIDRAGAPSPVAVAGHVSAAAV